MYVPATPAPADPILAPLATLSAVPMPLGPPERSTLTVRSSQLEVLDGHEASVTGRLLEGGRPAASGEVVSLQALQAHGWSTLAWTSTGAHGRFRVGYVPRRLGSEEVRLRFAGRISALASDRRLPRLNVYRLTGASWYGGGGSLACGGWLTSSTLGVANKTLPCGTLVTLRYAGHSVRVPVIDRGPYVEGREFDLTEATKRALGFGDTGEVWSTS